MINKWSYSRLKTYESCPQKAKYKIIDKLPDPAGPAAARGTKYHKILEEYVGGVLPALPPDLAPNPPPLPAYLDKLNALREKKPKLEYQIAFTREWKPTDFFADNAWARAVYDVIYPNKYEVQVIDYKTGRPSPDHLQQLELYAATALILHPEAELAMCADWYLDNGPHSTLEFVLARNGLQDVLTRWTARVQVMETDTVFPARPGRHCSYCAFAKKKGGPCQFG